MPGDKLTDVEVVLVVTEWVLYGLSHLQPADKENESEDEEYREEDVRLVLLGLASDEGENEVDPDGEPDRLSVERR